MERKLKTCNRYEGLAPELAKASKSDLETEGRDDVGRSCRLIDYFSYTVHLYYVSDGNNNWWTEAFTPDFKEEPVSLIPTADTPKNTLCRVWNYNKAVAVKRYLFRVSPKETYPFICVDNGNSCGTGKDVTTWKHAEIIEYPDGTRPGEEK